MSCSKSYGPDEKEAGEINPHHHHHHHIHHNHGSHDEDASKNSCGHSSREETFHSVKHVGVEGLLGCGNSNAIANLKTGQTVLDLGSGGGLDCIAAAGKVGPTGLVIGIDADPDMLATAKENIKSKGLPENAVQFKEGKMENIPVEDEIADVVMSSFAINHSKDKPKVFREAFRVLKSGGLLAIVDVVATAEISDQIKSNLKNSCLPASSDIESLKNSISSAGFGSVTIDINEASRHLLEKRFKVEGMQNCFVVGNISAIK